MIWIRKDKGRKHRSLSWQCKEGFGLYLRNEDEMMVGDVGYCNHNVNNGPGLYLCNDLFMDIMKTWMSSRPTSS